MYYKKLIFRLETCGFYTCYNCPLVFTGFIKNKTEFKKLLKQIGIFEKILKFYSLK